MNLDLESLRRLSLLQAMDDAGLTRLAAVLEPRDYPDGGQIFAEGDPGDGMFFILSGTVLIVKRTGTNSAAHKTLAILEPGDYFGEMALFDRQPRSASAIATGITRVLRLSTDSFGVLHGGAGHAGLGVLFAMIRTAGERIRRLNAQVVVYDEIGKAIGEAETLDELLEVVLRQLSWATLADWGLFVLRSQFSDRLEVRSTVNLELSTSQKDAISSGQGFPASALHETEGRLVQDLDVEQPFKPGVRLGFETSPLLLMPVALQGQLLGVVALGGRQPGQFDLNDLNLARGVARQVAQAIVNARHREEDQARTRHGRQYVRF